MTLAREGESAAPASKGKGRVVPATPDTNDEAAEDLRVATPADNEELDLKRKGFVINHPKVSPSLVLSLPSANDFLVRTLS